MKHFQPIFIKKTGNKWLNLDITLPSKSKLHDFFLKKLEGLQTSRFRFYNLGHENYILAVNPLLSTENPSKPDVEYIDEWKYSYRVTLYDADTYNVSNFLCSGILMSSQWVLTSASCNLGEDVALLIGVHTLPKNISEHNKYGVLRKVYSINENLELIQMDRPVQWNFKVPDIRSVQMHEMEHLLRRGKCRLLSWIPVDIEKEIFELRQYPQLGFRQGTVDKNSIRVSLMQPYHISKKDIGSSILCDDVITGVLTDVDQAQEAMTVELVCPVLEWITFFTKQGAYFEVSARKITLRNWADRVDHQYLGLFLLNLGFLFV